MLSPDEPGRFVPVHGSRLWVVERGDPAGFPVLVLHGGPGLDHHMFADYLDPLAADGRYRLVLVDQRAQGRSDRDAPPETWTLSQLASDVSAVAADLGAERYAVLGHSFGAFVALQHAVDGPGAAAATIVSAGIPSTSWLGGLADALATFEPVDLREQVARSWAAQSTVATEADALQLLMDQLPWHFADPRDPRIADYARRVSGMRCAPDVLRWFANNDYGGIEVTERLGRVSSPLLVLTGRHERTWPVGAAEAIAAGVPGGQLVVLENCAHLSFAEDPDAYLAAVRSFLDRVIG